MQKFSQKSLILSKKKVQSNLGYTNLSCTKSWNIRIFCPVPARSPPKSELYESLSYTMFSAVPCDSYNPGLTVTLD